VCLEESLLSLPETKSNREKRDQLELGLPKGKGIPYGEMGKENDRVEEENGNLT